MAQEEVFVIYRNGEMYCERGRKTAYLTKGSAKSVITSDSKFLAEVRTQGYYDLTSKERSKIAKKIAEEVFEIVTYTPKGSDK